MADEGGAEAGQASVDDAVPAVAAAEIPPTGGSTCPWCSAPLGSVAPERCPTCGAGLVEDPEASVPGVTTIDPEAVRRAASWERIRRGASFRSFFESNREEMPIAEVVPSSLSALGPPSAEVRQEMQRLRAELAATAEREAEQEALDRAAIEQHGPLEQHGPVEQEALTAETFEPDPVAAVPVAAHGDDSPSPAPGSVEAAPTAVSSEVDTPAEETEARSAPGSSPPGSRPRRSRRGPAQH
jgi:hypothetical protein